MKKVHWGKVYNPKAQQTFSRGYGQHMNVTGQLYHSGPDFNHRIAGHLFRSILFQRLKSTVRKSGHFCFLGW